MEYLHDLLTEMAIDFRIVRDINNVGRFASWKDIEAIDDLEAATVFYQQPRIEEGGFYRTSYEFLEKGLHRSRDRSASGGRAELQRRVLLSGRRQRLGHDTAVYPDCCAASAGLLVEPGRLAAPPLQNRVSRFDSPEIVPSCRAARNERPGTMLSAIESPEMLTRSLTLTKLVQSIQSLPVSPIAL